MPQVASISILIVHLLLAWAVIIAVAKGLGEVFKYGKQPMVVGELVGGILLGPSFLGTFFPQIKGFIFPPDVAPWIDWIAQAGAVLYMFFIGLEFDWPTLRQSGKSTVVISLASIVFPFLLGLAFAGGTGAALIGPMANRTAFALFVGVAMAITAFPVLARILADTGLRATPMGNLSLACAAINDFVAWCLLAWAICVAQAKTTDGVQTLVLATGYFAVMFWMVRPLLKKASRIGIVGLAILLTVSASITTLIGLHAIFGAFLLGAIMPKESALAGPTAHRAEGLVRVWLLPVFFAYTGLRTQINLLDSPHDWALCAIVIVLATAGKLGGTAAAARFCGLRWRSALMLGVLMNTRGLVELIVLNAGFELKLIPAKLFTMLVVMALATTAMTCPLLHWLRRKETGADGRT